MEFNTEIATFQGAIISADNVHNFTRINSKGGNEEKIKFIIQSIKTFLQVERYIDENGLIDAKESSMRKFAMYIILNSDLPGLDDMIIITDLEPMIWSIPTVSKYLMCEMIWQLHMENFIYEMIPRCWPQFGIEIAEAFIENFKYLSPTECLNRLYKLSTTCYALICRLANFNLRDDSLLSATTTTAFTNFENCLKYYKNPPNKHRLDSLSTDALYKYKGIHLKSLLNLVYDCLDMFTQNIDTNSDHPIYQLTFNREYLFASNFKISESSNTVVVECLDNSNTVLLDVFQQIVMDVSVNIFCAWSEYEEEDGKSYQQSIGELCHKVQQKLESINIVSEHPVVSMLQLMARKPTNVKDIINSTERAVILEKINNNDEQSSQWIHALAFYEELYKDIELIRVIDTNVNNFDNEECHKLHKMLKKSIIDNNEDQKLLINLRFRLLSKCDTTTKHKILKAHFKEQILVDSVLPAEDFDTKLNEMFNKFIADTNVNHSDVLVVFYENPQKVYSKIFSLASKNSELMEIMLKLMTYLQDYTKYYYATDTEPCLVKVMKEMLMQISEVAVYSNNIVKFICKLKQNEIISSSQLLILVIMPSIHTALVSADIKQLHNQIHLLTEGYTMEQLDSYRAPMLVMVAQIMDTVRVRTLRTFTQQAISTLELAIEFQKSIINTYRDIIPDNDGSWLRRKVQDLNLQPLNFYYFNCLWNIENCNFLESVTGMEELRSDTPYTEPAKHFTRILPFAILNEWLRLWDDMIFAGYRDSTALCALHATVATLCEAVNKYRSDKARDSILYLYTNLVHILRYKFLKEPLENTQVKIAIAYLSKTLTTTNPLDVPDIETILMPFLAYLSSRKADFTVNINKYFKDSRYVNVVSRFFPNENDEDS